MKRIISMDANTGEVLQGAMLGVFFPKRQNGFVEGWVAVAQEALRMLSKTNLGEQGYRVLFAVLARLDFENFILLNQTEIAEDIEMHRSDVSKAISKLEKLGVLLRGPKDGRVSTFRLNPTFGWKGSATNHRKALKERMAVAGIKGVVGGE